MAERRAGSIAEIIYFPFDLPWVVKRMLALINPALVIIFENELWPNFISICQRRHVPIVLLNARMSPRSFAGYKKIKPLISSLLTKLTLIGSQTEAEAERYRFFANGTVPIKIIGNSKYDWPAHINDEKCSQLKQDLGIKTGDLVLIAGSTHALEETMILDICKRFKNETNKQAGKKIKIIIAPRHPERFDEVAEIIKNNGYNVIRYSEKGQFTHKNDVYLLDTIGLLANYYALASVSFVGGTLAKVGGHNLLEPYLYGVPVVCGPHLYKTRETAAILNNENALFIGNDAQEIENKIVMLLLDKNLRQQMGKIGKSWLNKNSGAVARAMAEISVFIPIASVSVSLSEDISNLTRQVAIGRVNPWQKLKEKSKESKNEQL